MRKALIIVTLLLGLIIGYLAGCRSHGHSRTLTHDPAPGQYWHGQSGDERIVRCVTREGGQVRVWWYRKNDVGADRACTLKTWKQWARVHQAKVDQ